jgi:hypothetical protein
MSLSRWSTVLLVVGSSDFVGTKVGLPQGILWGAFHKFVIRNFHREVHENYKIYSRWMHFSFEKFSTHTMYGQWDDVFVSCCALAVCQSLSENAVFLLAVSNILDLQNIVVKWRMTVFRADTMSWQVFIHQDLNLVCEKPNDIHTQCFTLSLWGEHSIMVSISLLWRSDRYCRWSSK